MKCVNCGRREAEYLVFEDELMPLCRECFDEYCYNFGEMNLTYWNLDELKHELERFVKTINEELKCLQDNYSRLLQEYLKLKKGTEGK